MPYATKPIIKYTYPSNEETALKIFQKEQRQLKQIDNQTFNYMVVKVNIKGKAYIVISSYHGYEVDF